MEDIITKLREVADDIESEKHIYYSLEDTLRDYADQLEYNYAWKSSRLFRPKRFEVVLGYARETRFPPVKCYWDGLRWHPISTDSYISETVVREITHWMREIELPK